MDEPENPEIQSHSILGVYFTWCWLLGGVFFDVETGVPRTCFVLFDCSVFDLSLVWDRSVKSYRYVNGITVDFLECQESTSIGPLFSSSSKPR